MAARSSVADIVYRTLLRLYPVRFQEEFAADMALDFADARQEAWVEDGWIGLLRVWLCAASDVARSLTLQWMRTHIPLIAVVSMAIALSAAAVAQTLVPKEPFFVNLPPHDRDLAALMLLTASVVLVIASTIIFTLWFLRPLLYRGSQRRR